MRDIWGLLLQNLTASGAAALLLCVKRLLRDKLTPRWQFNVWGVLALVLLIPAGRFGRYALINWPWLVETAKTALIGEYTLTQVDAPIPLPPLKVPGAATEWVFAIYCAGVLFFLLRYLISYVLLRLTLKHGAAASSDCLERVQAAAAQYGLPVCRAVELNGLPTAFVCGVLRPILALPAEVVLDDKVIVHELLHLKYHDTALGMVICLFRCIYWCNPLLWYCAGRAENDLESLCDCRVLERLEGEERRDYGRILLSMTNERYAHTPGASSLANGGRNITRRIEAIARFKRYPAGMGLVSVCVAVIMALPLTLGAKAEGVYTRMPADPMFNQALSMASARTVRCTTPAGAFDTYAKAVICRNGIYRAMCAPLEDHAALAAEMEAVRKLSGTSYCWEPDLPDSIDTEKGYYVYNLIRVDNGYEGTLGLGMRWIEDHVRQENDSNGIYIAFQPIRAESRPEGWVVLPQGDFDVVFAEGRHTLTQWGCEQLPAHRYEAQAEDFKVITTYRTAWQTDTWTSSKSNLFQSTFFNTTPLPDAEFYGYYATETWVEYTGDEAAKSDITRVGVCVRPVSSVDSRPESEPPGKDVQVDEVEAEDHVSVQGSSTDGSSWGNVKLEPGWDNTVRFGGGGSSLTWKEFDPPAAYAADLYVNGGKLAELILLPVEGGDRS